MLDGLRDQVLYARCLVGFHDLNNLWLNDEGSFLSDSLLQCQFVGSGLKSCLFLSLCRDKITLDKIVIESQIQRNRIGLSKWWLLWIWFVKEVPSWLTKLQHAVSKIINRHVSFSPNINNLDFGIVFYVLLLIKHEKNDSLEYFESQIIMFIHASLNIKFYLTGIVKPSQLSTTVASVVPMIKPNFVKLKFPRKSTWLFLHYWPGAAG